MSTHPVPVLMSDYGDGVFTAAVLDGPEVQAVGATAAEAFSQVADRLRKLARRGADEYWPSIQKYEASTRHVTVRLFYTDKKRRFPASRELRFPVRVILGQYDDDSVECFLPDFESVFYCPALRELDDLISGQVRASAAQMSGREIAAATPPVHWEVRTVIVRPRERDEHGATTLPDELTSVATPMHRRVRGQTTASARGRRESVGQIVAAAEHGNLIVVGPSGCGKTTLIRAAATGIQSVAEARATLESKPPPAPQIWQTSAQHLIAGMQFLGQWEERVEEVIAAAESIGATLAIDSLVDLVRLGGSGPADSVAAFLLPFLRRGEVRLIAECDDEGLQATRRMLPGFVESFTLFRVPTIGSEAVAAIIDESFTAARRNHRREIISTAATTIATLMQRFAAHAAPPAPAIAVADDLLACDGPIDGPAISAAITRATGLPAIVLDDDQTLTAQAVRDKLSSHVIGQDAAVDAAASVVLRVKAGLCDPARPIATFLFAGPTGVGKTQLAKSLADELFGAAKVGGVDSPLIRLDMSEYADYAAAARLMTAPDGKVAAWIGQLRRRPMSVLLLDEFEKASAEVHDVWLSGFDEGRLTDRFGRVTSLQSTIIILTSNVGGSDASSLGFGGDDSDQIRRRFDKAVRDAFRIEMINRLDDVITFRPLSAADVRKIVVKELQTLSRREGLTRRNITLHWSELTIDRLAKTGFDPKLGARPLQRAIDQTVVAGLAKRILRDDETNIDLDTL